MRKKLYTVNFKAEFYRFEFRVFFLLDWFLITKIKEFSLSHNLSIAGGGENNWIHTFPKGISAMWNETNQDLNSCHRVNFQRW